MSGYNLIHGDCYSFIPTIPDKSIDLVITDPPYDFGGIKGGGLYKPVDKESGEENPYNRGSENSLTKLKELDSIDFNASEFLELLKPKMKLFYGYFFCNKKLVPDYLNFAIKNKYTFEILILYKTNPIPAKNNHFLPDMEYCVMIRDKGTFFSKECTLDDYRKVFSVSSSGKKLHPAEKPVEFLERFVRVSCPENGTVLDPFMGSGSTGIACIQNERNFIGVEKDDKYFDISSNRIKDRSNELKGIGSLFEGI